MKILIILMIVLLLWLLLFRKKKKQKGAAPSPPLVTPVTQPPAKEPGEPTITRHHTRLLERKTYIRGRLFAKYYGELDYIKDLQDLVRERYYDFTLYDAEIREGLIRRNNEGPFPEFHEEELFPGPIQPNPLPCSISVAGAHGPFKVLLHDVKLARIDLNKHRLLHQQEDDEVFGTLEAEITGHVLEQFEERFETTVPVEHIDTPEMAVMGSTAVVKKNTRPYSTELPTGRTKTDQGYRWTEYWYSDKKTTYWGRPVLIAGQEAGCATTLGWLLLIIAGGFFLAAIGAQGIMVLLALAAAALLAVFFSAFLRALLWIGLALIVVLAVLSLMEGGKARATANISPVRDELTETSRQETGWTNTRDSTVLDSVIVHHRIWKGYDSGRYEGDISIRVSDWRASSVYKNGMAVPPGQLAGYDGMLSGLSEQDSVRLGGVYRLLDSVRRAARLDSIAFAETVVAFVQDIPYALVLDGDCNPGGYTDLFTRRYLSSAGAVCEGYQRFGINSPVEFMATLKGDCDTRTLLLFTLLSHYGYDVAILSSELYAHSLLGICLPLGGHMFPYRGRQYVLWETTAAGARPGLIPKEMGDLSHWRISLIAKK
ncbi:MAG TPA: hypothetical protein VHD83_19105 [Puia sp.]|nr:hypothetical protein [Puia sp.]